MAYEPKLNPQRGFMIEKFQPITKQDVYLVKQMLNENDEVVIGVGAAGISHEPGYVMTAGERVESIDFTLQNNGVDPNKYMIIPVENAPEATQWVSEVMMVTPKWDKLYTRNFKNASMFKSFQRQHGYEIEMIDEQKPEKDYFELMAQNLNGNKTSKQEFDLYIPDAAMDWMTLKNIDKRVDIIYNRKNQEEKPLEQKRALFLGGMQPFTGIYSENTGHISNIKNALKDHEGVVIALGSAQQSHKESDPLTAGKRIDVVRYSLQKNGVSADKFFIIPIKDIPANAGYSTKVVSMCPNFNSVIAGNDWTKQLFGEGKYNIIPVERNVSKDGNPISGTRVRNSVRDILKTDLKKGDLVTSGVIKKIEKSLEGMIDSATLEKLNNVGFYDTMNFLAFANE